VVMMPAGRNSRIVHQSSLAVLPADTSGAIAKNGRRSENFAFSVSEIPQGIFNMPYNLTTWDLRLYFPSEGRCDVVFFIALETSSPRPGFNPRPLGPVASTLTTTPPRRRPVVVHYRVQ
jgi:hypothetical protein